MTIPSEMCLDKHYIQFAVAADSNINLILLQCDQQMHTLHKNYNDVLMRKFLYVSNPTGPSQRMCSCTNKCPTLLPLPVYTSPSNKIHREVGRAKDLSAAR